MASSLLTFFSSYIIEKLHHFQGLLFCHLRCFKENICCFLKISQISVTSKINYTGILTKIVYFKVCFGQIWANFKQFMKFFIFILVILKNLKEIGLYSFFRIWPFWNYLRPNLAGFLIFLGLATLSQLLLLI